MHTTTLLAIAMAAAIAVADFQIYNVQDAYADGLGDSYLNTGFLFFNTEPSCDDVNNADFIAGTDDASSSGVRAEVSDPTQLIGDQDVTLLEWNTDMGHFTIYEDSSYQITPADGSPLVGSCVRDSGDDFQCAFGATDSFTGVRWFLCTSPLTVP